MPKTEIITRKLIAARIDDLLNKKISVRDFGDEMLFFFVNPDDKYKYEAGYKDLIEEVLAEFTDMHDAEQGDVGYEPDIPSQERLIELKNKLQETT